MNLVKNQVRLTAIACSGWLAVCLLFTGCIDSDRISFRLVFPDEEARQKVSSITFFIFGPGQTECPSLLDQTADPHSLLPDTLFQVAYPATGPIMLKAPPKEKTLLFVEAIGQGGAVLLLGCRAVEIGSTGAALVIELMRICGNQVDEIPGNKVDDDCDGRIDEQDICQGYPDEADADGDGVPDGCDHCPQDPGKLEPGFCGCGVADTDSDLDGTVDCLSSRCAPTSCLAQGKNCDDIADGCDGTLHCGGCLAPQVCGGGGVPNVCGCTPTTSCLAQGKNCGSIDDGCGETLDCGSCPWPQTCGVGGLAGVCGGSVVAGPVETFDDNSMDASIWESWSDPGATIAERNQQLEIKPSNDNGYAGITSRNMFDLQDRVCFVEVRQVANISSSKVETYFLVAESLSSYLLIYATANSLKFETSVNGNLTTLASSAYNNTAMRWWRFRESSGTIYAEYASTSAGPWSELGHATNPFSLAAVELELSTGSWDVISSPGTAIFDNLNYPQ